MFWPLSRGTGFKVSVDLGTGTAEPRASNKNQNGRDKSAGALSATWLFADKRREAFLQNVSSESGLFHYCAPFLFAFMFVLLFRPM